MQQVINKAMDTTIGRIGVSIVFIIVGAAFLLFSSLAGAEFELRLLLMGIFLSGVGVLILVVTVYRLLFPPQIIRSDRAAERRAQSIIKKGRALPLPQPFKQSPAIQKSRVTQAARYANELRQITARWQKQEPQTDDVRRRPANFDQTVTAVRGVTGDWSQLADPLQAFESMPAPWRWVGAAEVMRPLSFVRNDLFVPAAVRQGLRFVVEAQNADPQNVDALLIRAMLLVSTSDPQWLRMAEETLAQARQLAPSHPRLPLAEMAFYRRTGAYDNALAANDRAAALATTPEQVYQCHVNKANILMEANRLEEAAAVYGEITRENDRNPWAWHNYSSVLTRLSRFEEALAASDRALEIMEFPVALNLNASLRSRLGKTPRPLSIT